MVSVSNKVQTSKDIRINFADYYIPKDKQSYAHQQVAKYLLFGGALGGGKSFWLCAEAINHCLKFPGARAVIIRKERTVIIDTIWVTFHKVCPKEAIYHIDNRQLKITLFNGSEIMFMPVDIRKDPLLNKIKGLEISWFGIDEANELPEQVFTMLKTRLRWILPNKVIPRYEGRLTSNPENCWLIPQFVESDDPHHMYVESLTTDNYSEDSDYYKILKQAFKDDPDLEEKYLRANWALTTKINQLIPSESILKAEQTLEHGSGTGLGVDPARFGKDETVFVYMEDGNIADIQAFKKWAITKTADHTKRLIDKHKIDPNYVGVDGVGLGAGVVDILHRDGYMVEDIVGGARVDEERIDLGVWKPFNLRSQMYWVMRQDMIDGKIGNVTDSVLQRQLGWIEYEIQGGRTIRVASKEAIKAIHQKSPDRADGLMYANWVKYRRAKGGVFLPIGA